MHYLARIDCGDEHDMFCADRHIDGWRYAYLRSVEKSRHRLIREARPFDVTLFVVEADKRRRYVARIVCAECLPESHAAAAQAAFEQCGWSVAGDRPAPAFDAGAGPDEPEAAPAQRFNIRFRLDGIRRYPQQAYASDDDPVQLLHRYQLHGADDRAPPPSLRSPEHAVMRRRLVAQLQTAHPRGRIDTDADGADVLMHDSAETYVFEIRTELAPRIALRRALDRVVERYLDGIDDAQALRLVVVVREEPDASDLRYLSLLRGLLGLPIACRVVSADLPE
ncbi:MAG TPA: hypothetical protein VM555_06155 [Tahibacter sp.]|nr:hypothetical protein [Tahibacter sp.]